MALLNYEVLKNSGYDGYILENAPEKVMQFGEGNFLRAFVDYFFDIANEKADWNGKVVLVQPISQGLTDYINNQQGLYTLYLRGSQDGQKVDEKRVISSVSRCLNPYTDWDKVLELAKSDDLEIIVSNTTEAGIVHDNESAFDQVPPTSFPAKLTRVLYERFTAGKPGLVILSCELIDNNGKELQKCVNQYIDDWKLSEDFRKWVNEENTFCSTLVDRIVPGRIRDPKEVERLNAANGYEDPLTDVGEVFGVWVIEGPDGLEDKLPFKKAGVNVMVVPDVTPYKKRKVRILNGAHTGFVLGAYLAGYDIVRDCMHDATILEYMNHMLYDEVIPTLPLDKDDLKQFAAAVQDRFNNPFVQSLRQPRADEHLPELHQQVARPQHAHLPGLRQGEGRAAEVPDHLLRDVHSVLLQRHPGADRQGPGLQAPQRRRVHRQRRPLGAGVLLRPQGRQPGGSGPRRDDQHRHVGPGPDPGARLRGRGRAHPEAHPQGRRAGGLQGDPVIQFGIGNGELGMKTDSPFP